jgi:hypothetical protein
MAAFPKGFLSVTLALTQVPDVDSSTRSIAADLAAAALTDHITDANLEATLTSMRSLGASPRVTYGRPQWEKLLRRVREKVAEKEGGGGVVGAFLCGPEGLMREVRGVCGDVSRGTTVELRVHQEVFG